jgi:hypothetical protein
MRAESLLKDLRNACRILVEGTERERPLGSLGSKWEENIEMDCRKM